MPKIMALIDSNDIIENIISCSNYQKETDNIKDPQGREISLKDIYQNGKWYTQNGEEILTPLEKFQKEIKKLNNEKISLKNSYKKGVNSL